MIVPRLTNDAATQVLYPLLWASDAGLQRHRAEDSGLGAGAPLDLALVEGLKLALALAEVWRCGGRARGAAGRERDGSLEEAQPLRDLSGEESDDVLVVGLNRAVDVMSKKLDSVRSLGPHPADKEPVMIRKGRFGPYAQHGLRGEESERQVAAADVLVVTKADLADPSGVERSLGALNPVASVVRAVQGDIDSALLLGRRGAARVEEPQALSGDADGHGGHRHEERRPGTHRH